MKRHHTGHHIEAWVPESLVHALHTRCRRTGESVAHVVRSALAAELDIEHHTIFQISTSTALVEGVYQGCVTVAEIKKHGDFGLGTFDSLDGEGIMLDGQVWHARSDGSLAIAGDNESAPFWVGTNFAAKRKALLESVTGWDDLCRRIDAFRTSPNIFTSIRVKGIFDTIQYRVVCRTAPGNDLVTATSQQTVFNLQRCAATLVGFWTPEYSKTLGIPGYHLHLLTDDHRYGGHVFCVTGSALSLEIMEDDHLVLALPENQAFLTANLSADPDKVLAKAESASKKQFT